MNPLALECLLSRFSTGPKHLVDPGPNASQLELMVQAGLRGPDHGELVPWRVVVIDGAAKVRMADLFVQHAQQKGKSPEAIEMERDRALRAPTTLAVIAQIDPAHPLVPAHEQWMCIGGAITNMLNAAHAMGFGAKILSGDKTRSASILQAFCQPGETLAGWITLGTPNKKPSTNKPKDWRRVLSPW